MTSHPWLKPSDALVAKVVRTRVRQALRTLPAIPRNRLGRHGPPWSSLLAALPAVLRTQPERLFSAAARVDVLSALLDLATGPIDDQRAERALVTLWLGLAGHPGLDSPLALPGPFGTRVVDPHAPRALELNGARGLVATASGAVAVGPDGRWPLDAFVAAPLPDVGGTVIVDQRLGAPDAAVVARVQAALTRVTPALPGGRLERVTIGDGNAAMGEARIGSEADPADLVASAHTAFVRAAAALNPALRADGVIVEGGRRIPPTDVLARACGNAVALPWRADHARATAAIRHDLDAIARVSEPTPTGAALVAAVRALAGSGTDGGRAALLVNVDADDFVYSFQFGQSVERRCVERGLRVDRMVIATGQNRDLAVELGQPVPPPIADGTEIAVDTDADPRVSASLQRLAASRYEVVVANVRPRLFYDLVAAGLLATPTLAWDRHLHHGLREEHARRSEIASRVGALPIRIWSPFGELGFHGPFAEVGIERTANRAWPMDLAFFRSTAARRPNRLFAGGDSGRDWTLLLEAIRELPLEVHLVTAHASPAAVPSNVHLDRHLPLAAFRDAMATASVTAIPIVDPLLATGVTVLTMAMALGTAVVATRTTWLTQYVTDGEEALLVPAGDVGAFRDAIMRLYEDGALRRRLVDNASRRVAALCDLEAFTGSMFATLE
jgi:glycosyl transferase family 1